NVAGLNRKRELRGNASVDVEGVAGGAGEARGGGGERVTGAEFVDAEVGESCYAVDGGEGERAGERAASRIVGDGHGDHIGGRSDRITLSIFDSHLHRRSDGSTRGNVTGLHSESEFGGGTSCYVEGAACGSRKTGGAGRERVACAGLVD